MLKAISAVKKNKAAKREELPQSLNGAAREVLTERVTSEQRLKRNDCVSGGNVRRQRAS